VISKTIRDAILAQLSAPGSGINDRMLLLAANYGQDAYAIDWSDASPNFLFGRIDPDSIEESSVLTYPLVTIDTGAAVGQDIIYDSTFSGSVMALIDIHHSWPNESVLSDFASLVDMTEDAVISCLHDPNQQNIWSSFGNLLLAKGGITSQRGRITFGGENWRQSLRISCRMELTV